MKLIMVLWWGFISVFSVVIFVGVFGYWIMEGWDWGDCFWMVLIIISIIGFGEVVLFLFLGCLVIVLIVVGGLVVV